MGKSTRRLVKPAKKSSSLSINSQDPLRAIGFRDPDGEILTPARIEGAALADLLLRGLAPGDDPTLEAIPLAVAREMESLNDRLAEQGIAHPMATHLYSWAARLRVGAELQRRVSRKGRAA